MSTVLKRIYPLLLTLFLGLLPGASVVVALSLSQNETSAGALQQGYDRAQAEGTPVISRTEQVFLPIVFKDYDPEALDMVRFMVSEDERLYEVQHSGGSQARHQTQVDGEVFYHTKGNEISAEWEELWYTGQYIYRGTDTSPGNGQYYTLRDPGIYGSKWAPRFWAVGEIFERNPQVTFYQKVNCSAVAGGTQRSFLLFEEYYPEYKFESGITLKNVVQFAWLLQPDGQPIERYYYAEFYGLVGWWSNSGAHSYISEIHGPGDRPDNLREEIPCLDKSPSAPPQFTGPLPFWPGEHRR